MILSPFSLLLCAVHHSACSLKYNCMLGHLLPPRTCRCIRIKYLPMCVYIDIYIFLSLFIYVYVHTHTYASAIIYSSELQELRSLTGLWWDYLKASRTPSNLMSIVNLALLSLLLMVAHMVGPSMTTLNLQVASHA